MVLRFNFFKPFIQVYNIYKSNNYNSNEYNDLMHGFISFGYNYLGLKYNEYCNLYKNITIYMDFLKFAQINITEFSNICLLIPTECDFGFKTIDMQFIISDFQPPILYAQKEGRSILQGNETLIETICVYKNVYITYIKRYIRAVDDYDCFIVLSIVPITNLIRPQ